MDISQIAAATSRPYRALLREWQISDKLFSSKQLAFNMEAQTQTQWCWAATSTSVSLFYWLSSNWTQCLVANAELERDDCCQNPVPAAANIPWYLNRALTRTSNFVSQTGQISFQEVRAEIDAARPIGVRIGWDGGGGHFMVIYGYSLIGTTEFFDIDDPIFGKSHLTVDDFATNYQGRGTWTNTYFTKSSLRMPIKQLIPIESVFDRIWEMRPLLSLKQNQNTPRTPRDAEPDVADASLGMAHRVYSLGLDALMRESNPMPQPVNLRVYELQNGKPRAFFDVTETEQPRVMQMSASQSHLAPFTRGLTAALATVNRSKLDCELRLFRVPALNFEALWLHYDEEARDVLVPLLGISPLPPFKPIPLTKALAALREAARNLGPLDEEKGG